MDYKEETQLTKKERRKIYFYFIKYYLFGGSNGFCYLIGQVRLKFKLRERLYNIDHLFELATFRPVSFYNGTGYWFKIRGYGNIDLKRLKISFKCWLLTFK